MDKVIKPRHWHSMLQAGRLYSFKFKRHIKQMESGTLKTKERKFLYLFIKAFKWSLLSIVLLHIANVIRRGLEYPFDDVNDFFKKLLITLGFALPVYLIISIVLGLVFGFVTLKINKRHTTPGLKK